MAEPTGRAKTARDFFWTKVRKTDGCWEWTGSRTNKAYGQFYDGLRGVRAHRYSWEIEHGAIPSGACVLHRCDDPICVRPDHLFLGSHAENMADMTTKRRHWCQRKTHCPKGHAYTEGNTYRKSSGARQCKACLLVQKPITAAGGQ